SPSFQPKLSEIAYDALPAKIGTANKPVPMMPIANNHVAALPAKGRKASAASLAVLISVMPCANKVAAQAAIIKNITTLDTNIPDQTSVRISLISCKEVSFRDLIVLRPAKISSSTSCEVCQKNKYGDMVVPSMAVTKNICSREKDMAGRNVPRKTWLHGRCTIKAAKTYESNAMVNHFK